MEYKLEEIITKTGFNNVLKRDKILSKDKIDLYYNIQEFISISLEENLENGLDYLGKYLQSRYEIKDKYQLKIKRNKEDFNLEEIVKSFNSIISSNKLSESIEMIYSLTKQYINSEEIIFNDISGNKEAKDLLKRLEIIYSNYNFEKNKNNFSEKIDFPRSILLYGPPGTGKTSLIKNTIQQLKEKCDGFVDVTYFDSSFKSKWYGETTKNLGEILSRPKDNSKLYVNVLDDIDLLFPKRDYDSLFVEKEILNEFMKFFDGIDKYENVLNFITSNSPESLDQALIQRIAESIVYVPGPQSKKEYENALKYHFRKAIDSNLINLNKSDWRKVSEKIMKKGFTGREIRDLSKRVYLDLVNIEEEEIDKIDLNRIERLIKN